MKLFKYSFIVLAILLILAGQSFAGSTYYDQDVSEIQRPGKLLYYGTVTFSDSGTGTIYYTQAFYIGGVNTAYGLGRFICSEAGVEDVNVFVEYSMDAETWVAGTTDTDLDAVGTTAVIDTFGLVRGVDQLLYSTWLFMRYEFLAGQAIGSTTLTWSVAFTKPSGLEYRDLAIIKDTQ